MTATYNAYDRQEIVHPTSASPYYLDVHGPARLVLCPDCGQMEFWTPDEERDHGYCRTRRPDGGMCVVCMD